MSRLLHYAGILMSAVTAVALLACGMIFFISLAAVPALVLAMVGHKLSPRRDKVSATHPDWAVLADLKMFWFSMTGRLDREIAEAERLPSFPSHPAISAG